MANTIIIKNSSTPAAVPLTTDLVLGELAINTRDGKLYLKKNDGTESIVEVGVAIVNVANKAEAVLLTPAAGDILYIRSDDGKGNVWRAIIGEPALTYSDDGGSFCGTVFIPTGGDGSAGWVRDYTEGVNPKWFGATGDGVTDDSTNIQAMLDADIANNYDLTNGVVYDLGGNTLTLANDITVNFKGGQFSNGTVTCDNTLFSGYKGLSDTISLSGSIKGSVLFDWFDCEMAASADYDTFINTNQATFGAVPTISSKNHNILKMLIIANYNIKFGRGIYPFDQEIELFGHTFKITGSGKRDTLLWAPSSAFLHYTAGGSTYPYFKDITIEAYNQVLLTDAWTVNAIHGLVMKDSFFISYVDNAFENDYSTAGGTGCPIYGSKIEEVGVYAGAGKACFYGWASASNIYDNVVDLHIYFNNQNPNNKGIILAIFHNSNMKIFRNSNISYSGFDYVYLLDRPSVLAYFHAEDNVFEVNTFAFKAIVKCTGATSSNLNLSLRNNVYVGAATDGYYYDLLELGNCYLRDMTDDVTLRCNALRNHSGDFVRNLTGLIDVGATKYRLQYFEPYANIVGAPVASALITPSTNMANLIGMADIYAVDSANISWFQVHQATKLITSDALPGFGSGLTASRPTVNLYPGYPFFDTTLGYRIWYDGTNWVDYAGTTV